MKSLSTLLRETEEQLEFDFGPKPEGNVITNFDEVKHNKPVLIRAWHGTNMGKYIEKEGFKIPEHERNPLNKNIQFKLGREGFLGRGVYFSDSKKTAGRYGTPEPISVKLYKPYVISSGYMDVFKELNIEKLKRKGYDGIICQGGKYGLTGESYRQGVAFYPQSVKITRDKPKLTKIQHMAKVKDKNTGETGTARIFGLTYKGRNSYTIRWNGSKRLDTKPRTEYNPDLKNIEVIG